MRGDEITWAGIGAHDAAQPVVVDRVDDTKLFLQSTLVDGPYNAGALRLANLAQGRSTVFRLDGGGDRLGAGSVVTLSQAGPALTETGVVQSIQAERITGALTTYRITLRKPVSQDVPLTKATTVASPVFSITVDRAAAPPKPAYHQVYADLSMDPQHPRFFAAVVAADDLRIVDAELADPPAITAPPFDQPRATVAPQNLAGGAAENLQTLSTADYQRALDTLRAVDDVNFIAIPDRQDHDVQSALLAHCELMQDRVAIFDSRRGLPMFGIGSVETQRAALDSQRGYGALYYPWLWVPQAVGSGRLLVPPSGHVAGIFARTDMRRGVHKAPAGEEATVSGALGVDEPMSDMEQGQLNIEGINVDPGLPPGWPAGRVGRPDHRDATRTGST